MNRSNVKASNDFIIIKWDGGKKLNTISNKAADQVRISKDNVSRKN